MGKQVSDPGCREFNFDGLIGPTHNYAGLSRDNVAAETNSGSVSSPKSAALQGIAKMRLLAGMGLAQAVLPPQERPHLPTLRALGFTGSDRELVEKAGKEDPGLLRGVTSASSMWAANAGTVSPGAETADGRTHITPASLGSKFHRSIEAPFTFRLMRRLFADESRFAVHEPLPGSANLGDEGAANHGRLTERHEKSGVELFFYGRSAFGATPGTRKHIPRQALEASKAVARLHLLDPARTVFIEQSSAAVDAGAFHNDVVCVINADVIMHHPEAFADPDAARDAIRQACPFEVDFISTPDDVTLQDAVETYLFNSQLVSLPQGGMGLVLPEEVRKNPRTLRFVDELVAGGSAIRRLEFVDVRESMRNGGGPACLRLRVVLADADTAGLGGRVVFGDGLASGLEAWVDKHYRDRLEIADLSDPDLLDEAHGALDEITTLLELGSIYDFQR